MKRLLVALLTTASLLGAMLAPPALLSTPAMAACSDAGVLGITPWYRGLQKEVQGSCQIKSPANGEVGKFVTTIVLNVLQAGFTIAAYVAIFFIIKGGFLYIVSAGSSQGMEDGKKTITNAVIGLVIVLLAVAIINTIASIL